MNREQECKELSSLILTAIANYGDGCDNSKILFDLEQGLQNILFSKTEVKIYRETEIPLPAYACLGDGAMDVRCSYIEYCDDNLVICHTGIHMELPLFYKAHIKPRSNLTKHKWHIVNTPGLIDEGYRGEIQIRFRYDDPNVCIKDNKYLFPYKIGDRVAQLDIERYEPIKWVEVDSLDKLSKTERGEQGHGHTGTE